MDIALMLDLLVPGADYQGSVTNNSQAEFNKIRWNDSRAKPNWDELQTRWQSYITTPINKTFPEKLATEVQSITDKTLRKSAIRLVGLLTQMHKFGGPEYVTEEVDASSLPQAVKDKIKGLL